MHPVIEILAIGNELLLGETVDTNAAWIARRLAAEGIRVARKSTVGDDDADIRSALDAALRRTRVVVCTGGLGPTRDDLTRDSVAKHYGRGQHIDEGWMDVLRGRYAKRGIPMPEVNRVQALVPDGAQLLHNATGTAPGIALADDERGLTILLPGVPSEMRALMEEHVVPLLRTHLRVNGIVESRLIRTVGISEAALAERIDDIAADLAPLSLAFLPQAASVDLRITSWGDAPDAAALLDDAVQRLCDRLDADVYATDDTDLALTVGRLLRSAGLTIALAESCTGGLAAKRLTDFAGSSDYVHASFVTYHNDAKRDLLGVRPETLALHGAVSEQCAKEMAEGARSAARADVAIAITGIAGPGGGSEAKPVGTVWFAVALEGALAHRAGHAERFITRRLVHPGDRNDIRERAAQTALDLVRRALLPTAREAPTRA